MKMQTQQTTINITKANILHLFKLFIIKYLKWIIYIKFLCGMQKYNFAFQNRIQVLNAAIKFLDYCICLCETGDKSRLESHYLTLLY